MCNLVSVAEHMGVPRIVAGGGIPYPSGDPSVDPLLERAWRRKLVEQAVIALSTAVTEPTVFEVDRSAE